MQCRGSGHTYHGILDSDLDLTTPALALGLLVTNPGVIKLPRNKQDGASYSALHQFSLPLDFGRSIGKKQNSGGPSSQVAEISLV
ncbi:hypothetical protein SASPL_155660 [Salvia splendens]|uniref:Uncharacterized protein n=1 Tax=Salvia splendens TaxID=180675 RepID=A0A8X8VYC6_SALSN|nr:hypothetical protein SASPL_155660 [Salvia splendens]